MYWFTLSFLHIFSSSVHNSSSYYGNFRIYYFRTLYIHLSKSILIFMISNYLFVHTLGLIDLWYLSLNRLGFHICGILLLRCWFSGILLQSQLCCNRSVLGCCWHLRWVGSLQSRSSLLHIPLCIFCLCLLFFLFIIYFSFLIF